MERERERVREFGILKRVEKIWKDAQEVTKLNLAMVPTFQASEWMGVDFGGFTSINRRSCS